MNKKLFSQILLSFVLMIQLFAQRNFDISIFNTIKDMKNVTVSNSDIVIDGIKYELIDSDEKDILCYLKNNDDLFALKTTGLSASLYNTKTNESFYTFPLFYENPIVPLSELREEELRIYRNLQFARHGYVFKSPDLQNLFSSFSWYEKENSNSNVKLTKEEENIVNRCLSIEKEKKNAKKIDNFFKENEEYITNVIKIKNKEYTYSYNVIGTVRDVVNFDKLNISTKFILYIDNKVLLSIIDNKIYGENDKLLFEAKLPRTLYGWYITVSEGKTDPFIVSTTPYMDKGKESTDAVSFILNEKGSFEIENLLEKYKDLY